MAVEVRSFDIVDPGDLSGLDEAVAAVGAGSIRKLALFMKVGGEYEDGSRERAKAAAAAILEKHALADRTETVTVIGSEGASTPFGYAFLDLGATGAPGSAPRLAIGVAHVAPPAETDLDRAAGLPKIVAAVRAAMADAGLGPHEVATVIVNAPSPTTGDVKTRGRLARAAAALGAGVAIGELAADAVEDATIGRDDIHVARVQTYTGPTIRNTEAIVIGNKAGQGGDLVACACVTKELTDLRSLKTMLRAAGLALDGDGELVAPHRVRAILAKAGVRADGHVLGAPTTIYNSVTPPEKHVRAALSGVMGALFQTTRVFSTFDPVQQAPVGGGTYCCVVDAAQS